MILLYVERAFRFRAAEWLLAIVMFNWGWLLLMDRPAFVGPTYIELLKIASENTWGWICLAGGALRLGVLAVNGAWQAAPHIRAVMSAAGMFLWLQLTIAFLGAPTLSTALAVYPAAFVFDLYNAYRAACDAGRADRERVGGRIRHS